MALGAALLAAGACSRGEKSRKLEIVLVTKALDSEFWQRIKSLNRYECDYLNTPWPTPRQAIRDGMDAIQATIESDREPKTGGRES